MEPYRGLPDAEVLRRMDELAAAERLAIVDVVACLAEVDRRKLFSRTHPDVFRYCTERLKMSLGSAYRRIWTSRAADLYPEIYADLRDGSLTVCVVAHLARQLGLNKVGTALPSCRGKSIRDVEAWVAARMPPSAPPPDRVKVGPPMLRKDGQFVEPQEGGNMFDAAAPSAPLVPTYLYSFTASAELHAAIERLKDILWNARPFGSLDDFLKIAVEEYLSRHDLSLKVARANAASDKAPGAEKTRRAPNPVRDAVWARDGGRCAFVGEDGVRCACRRGLELDHVVPYSLGGASDDPANLRLLCREHNQSERRRVLGEGVLNLGFAAAKGPPAG